MSLFSGWKALYSNTTHAHTHTNILKICTCTNVHTYLHIKMHTCIYIVTHSGTHSYMQEHTHVHTHAHARTHTSCTLRSCLNHECMGMYPSWNTYLIKHHHNMHRKTFSLPNLLKNIQYCSDLGKLFFFLAACHTNALLRRTTWLQHSNHGIYLHY